MQNFDHFLRQRPYHVENTSSRPITEVKQRWAWLVLGWETAWEHQVLLASFFFFQICKIETFKSEGENMNKRVPTAPGVPRRSPIQVLTRPNVA